MADGKAHPKYLWLNGELVRWEDAYVHVSMLGWSTVSAVFEGIKAYWNPEEGQLYAYQFDEHLARFANSIKLQKMESRWSMAELKRAIFELLRANEAKSDTYIAPLAYFGDMAFYGREGDSSTHIRIIADPFTSHLGSGTTVTAGVSSWTRISDNVLSPRVKCLSNYQNSRLATLEARRNGYDQAILLNNQGKVAEGAASCLVIIRNGVAITSTVTSGILESITRQTVLRLLQESLDVPVQERDVDRTELYISDEAFFCGTGAEITPIRAIDGYTIGGGGLGPITTRLESLFHDVVRGRDQRFGYAQPVYEKVGAPAG